MIIYQELDAWKIAMQLANEVYEVAKTYPKEELFGLVSQTRRAAISVPANIAEAMGRRHTRDSLRFLFISRGSLYELDTLLRIANMRGYLSLASFEKVSELLQRALRVLNGFINFMEKSIIQ